MRLKIFRCIIIASIFFSCSKQKEWHKFVMNGKTVFITMKQYSDSSYSLQLFMNDSLNSEWELKYPVYNINFGDVNNDGRPEIVVGTIKSTRFDPKIGKRLFIFKVTDDFYIRPLWLGSRVSQPLFNFRVKEEKPETKIQTIEQESDGSCLVGEYKWKGFGLEHVRYIKRHITLKEAQHILNSNKH